MPAAAKRTDRSRWLAGFCLGLLALVLAAGQRPLYAQKAATPPNPKAAPATSPAEAQQTAPPLVGSAELPGEVKPELYYLLDKSGKIVPVPGFTFEDFIKLHRLQKRLDQQDEQPRYSIQSLDVSGKVVGDRAELLLEVEILVREAGWVRVPLRLETAALVEQPKYDGPGEQLLRFDEKSDGYVVWIRGAAEKPRRLSLKLMLPVLTAGGESRLKTTLPRAVVSRLKLEVPREKVVGKLSDSGLLDPPQPLADGKTLLTGSGLGSEFDLVWRNADSPVANVPPVLEATGTLLVRIDGRSVNTEARLSVQSFGGQFDQFDVRLPPGAELGAANQRGIAVTVHDSPKTDRLSGKLVTVKLKDKTAGPVDVRLVTERPHSLAQADELIELAGFNVQGAVRQSGNIGVQVVGNWQINWGTMQHLRQVDELPEMLRGDSMVAGFEYFAQPCSLKARVLKRKTRIAVEPQYLYLVGAQQVQLQAKLKYVIRGAKTRTLHIKLPGWRIDDLGPANLVDVDGAVTGDPSDITIPLMEPSSGELELTLQAHLPNAPDAARLEFELPVLEAEAVGQASVVVLAADNVELTPLAEAMTGLTPQTLRPSMKLPERQQEPLVFRSEGNAGEFVATRGVHSQAISCEVHSEVELDEQQIRVDQTLAFRVEYEPVDTLSIKLPRTVPVDQLKVLLEGQKLTLATTGDEAQSDEQGTTMRLPLPAARIGLCELQVSYSLPHDKFLPSISNSVAVPLIMPAQGQLSHNYLSVSARPGLSVTHTAGQWSVDSDFRSGQSPALSLSSSQPNGEALLAVTVKDQPANGSTIIDRGWIQTWLTDAARQDRALFRFSSSESDLLVTLPDGVGAGGLEVLVDGTRLPAPELDRSNRLRVLLPAGRASQEHLLDLRYRFAQREPAGDMTFQSPQFKPGIWVRWLRWQLVLPANEHLFLSPAHFASESSWRWDKILWRRQPALEQRDLELWMELPTSSASASTAGAAAAGAAAGGSESQPDTRDQDVAAATNRYLFSTIEAPFPLKVWTASRAKIVFLSSLLVLAGGLLLIYVPRVRHPGLLFALGVAAMAGSLLAPDLALLVAQASSLGLALALVAAFLRRRVTVPAVAPPVPVKGSSRAIVDRSATEAYFRSGNVGSHSSTVTAPAVAQSSSPEAES